MGNDGAIGKRERNQRDTDAKIRACARAELAKAGPVALSMRAIARDAGMVSSAIYRYYPTREALLTALIIESYGELAQVLEEAGPATTAEGADGDGAAPAGSPGETWARRADALRRWALANPHQFQLIYGTPIPNYQAPPETIPAAARVAGLFLELAPPVPESSGGSPAAPDAESPVEEALAEQLADLGGAAAAPVLASLSQLIGHISLELAGHFTGTADPADHLWTYVVRTQVRNLGPGAD